MKLKKAKQNSLRFVGQMFSANIVTALCKSLKTIKVNDETIKKLDDENKTKIDRIPLLGGAMNIDICTDNVKLDEDIQLLYNAMGKDDEMISERLSRLSEVLKEMGY